VNFTAFQDPAAFLKRAQPFLEAQEVANSLILGVTIRLREHPEWTDTPPYLGIVENQGELALVAAITPPHNLLLAGGPSTGQTAVDVLVQSIHAESWPFPGVNAENRLAVQFARSWSRIAGAQFRTKIRLRAYELRQVVLPSHPPAGTLRLAAADDLDLIASWRAAFTRESLHEDPPENNCEMAQRGIQSETTYIWQDNRPVCMSLVTRPTPHGISIGGVYTPPEFRERGYASACVAALSQRQLDLGKAFCSLFTDLDYPTSNSIYQKIGYAPVCDFSVYRFDEAGE